MEDVEADQSAAEVEEREVDVAATLVTDHQPAEAMEPPQGAFDHPPDAAQPVAGVDAWPSDARHDAAPTQRLAVVAGRIRFVGVQFGRPVTRPTRPPAGTADRFDGVDHLFEERALINVGGGEPDRERATPTVDHKMALRARFAAIRRIRADLLGRPAPPLAGTWALSMLARDQSIWSASPS